MRVLVTALFAMTLFAPLARAADDGAPAAAPATTDHGPVSVFTVAPSGWYVEVRGGFATQDYTDPEANITYMQDIAVQSLDAPGVFRSFDHPQAYAFEVGRRRGAWCLGITTEQQRQRVHTLSAGTILGSMDATTLVATMDVRLTGSYRPRSLFGLEVGASAGMSFAHYSEDYSVRIFPQPDLNADYSGAYHASSFAGGPHLGWRRPLYGNAWLTARFAWIYRKFDELKGQRKSRSSDGTTITDTSLQRLDNGALAKIDGSGAQLSAGFSYTFGGRR